MSLRTGSLQALRGNAFLYRWINDSGCAFLLGDGCFRLILLEKSLRDFAHKREGGVEIGLAQKAEDEAVLVFTQHRQN
jgi:hypothetical protein